MAGVKLARQNIRSMDSFLVDWDVFSNHLHKKQPHHNDYDDIPFKETFEKHAVSKGLVQLIASTLQAASTAERDGFQRFFETRMRMIDAESDDSDLVTCVCYILCFKYYFTK